MKPLEVRLAESLHRTLEGFRDEIIFAELDEDAAECLDAVAEQFVLRNGLTLEEARGVVVGALFQRNAD